MRYFCFLLLTLFSVKAEIPDFKITTVPGGKYKIFKKQFTQHINVFGVRVFGTAKTPSEKLRHIAVILAEYLDNDENGKPDNIKVLNELLKRDAFMAVTENERAMERLDNDVFQDAGFHSGQGQFATEPIRGVIDLTRRSRKYYT